MCLWFLNATFLSARQGQTGRAIFYLLIAGLPFGAAAMWADSRQAPEEPGAQRRADNGRAIGGATVVPEDSVPQ